MDIDNQKHYWNSVSQQKTFTHPLNVELLSKYVNASSKIVDYGCGYGRLVNQLHELNYINVQGFDTSKALILRGSQSGVKSIACIDNADDLPLADNSVDCFLLFAVLTCIPSNQGQKKLLNLLFR